MATAMLMPLIVVKGYKGIVFGREDSVGSDSSKQQQYSSLMVP
jgi:hypothetical protein